MTAASTVVGCGPMISAVEGSLTQSPRNWVLVFDRVAVSPLWSRLACGEFKHVRAYSYVPFLHVWIFFDPHVGGIDITVAADGAPARAMVQSWIGPNRSDLMLMPVRSGGGRFPLLGWCVPSIKRLIGLHCGALRPDALWRHCLRNGGKPFKALHGRIEQQRTCADPAAAGGAAGLHAAAG